MDNRLPFPKSVYILAGVYILISYLTLYFQGNSLAFFVAEDRFFEYLGALAFFISSGFFLYAYVLKRRNTNNIPIPIIKQLAFLTLALVFFFGAGEEISWGQRIFGFTTPESLIENNVQGETTIHNLELFEGSERLVTIDRLFEIFWFSFTIVIPIVYWLSESGRRFFDQFLPVPHWSIGALFLLNYLWAKFLRLTFFRSYSYYMFIPSVNPKISYPQAIREISESNFAVLFVLVAFYLFLEAKNPGSSPTPDIPNSAKYINNP